METVLRQTKPNIAGRVDGGNNDLFNETIIDKDSDPNDEESIPLVHYQILSSMELDNKGQLVLYKEFSPFESQVFSAKERIVSKYYTHIVSLSMNTTVKLGSITIVHIITIIGLDIGHHQIY